MLAKTVAELYRGLKENERAICEQRPQNDRVERDRRPTQPRRGRCLPETRADQGEVGASHLHAGAAAPARPPWDNVPEQPMREDLPSQLESCLDSFDAAWQNPSPPQLEDFLPPETAPGRPQLLIELVCIDLEKRIKRGEPVRVESYLERFAELRTSDKALQELLLWEYDVRRRHGPSVNPEEYPQRFPELAPELALRLCPTVPPEGSSNSKGRRGRRCGARPAGIRAARPGGPGRHGRGLPRPGPGLDRDLAIKVLRPELAGDPGAERRFVKRRGSPVRCSIPASCPFTTSAGCPTAGCTSP